MIVKRVTSKEEVAGIKELQSNNLYRNVSNAERATEGFLTAGYTLEFLQKMNDSIPGIIAKENNNVVGYALVAAREIALKHALLKDLFTQIDLCVYDNKPMGSQNYIVVGQLCVAKEQRGKGVVKEMYQFYKKELCSKYDYCITDVDTENPRSVKAHLSAGFEVVGTLDFGGKEWHIVLWDWNK
jgi:hypothetical protein